MPAAPRSDSICRLDDIPALIEDDNHVFWDVRSDGEWTGANKRGTQRGGRIPGAVHLEWLHTLESPVRTLKSPAVLREMLGALGIHAGQAGDDVLTGRHPCGARLLPAATARLGPRGELRRLMARVRQRARAPNGDRVGGRAEPGNL